MSTSIPEIDIAPHDLQALARIAGEIFREIPGGNKPSPVSGASLPPAGTGVPPGGIPVGGFGAPLPTVPLPAQDFPVAPLASSPVPLSQGQGLAYVPSSAQTVPGGGVGGPLPAQQPLKLESIPLLSASLPGEAELKLMLTPAAVPSQPVLPTAQSAAAPNYYFLENSVPAAAVQPQAVPEAAHPAFDAAAFRADFPILKETVNGRPLIWLDNAATTQKPQSVIDRLKYFYEHENSNIHRAAHEMAARSTDAYEKSRDTVRRFLKAGSVDEIIFVRGATEGINLIAQSWGRRHIGAGDEIVVSWLEHHANIVPWQQLCQQTGAKLRVAPVDDDGQILLDEYEKLLNDRTKLVAFTQVSNALGTVTPAKQMIDLARRYGAHVLLDGAQSVSHMPVDVQALDCDWFVFSGHKVFGPTGIGAVYGKADVLDATPPWQGGGNMIRDVTFEKTEYHGAPAKFEAGTGNIADAVGLGAALDYVMRIGMENIARHEHDLLSYATVLLSDIPGLRIVGTAAEKAGVVSFVLKDIPPEDVGKALNKDGIAVRSGHHCAQPILRRFGLEASVRPSFALYNTFGDIDALASAVRRIRSGSSSVN